MSELKDESIEQGTRKRAQYDSAQRANLALNLEREDGGTLQILVEQDMRSHEEEPDIQQNTFLAIVPMARLPAIDGADQQPVGALIRPGRIYVFRKGKLWREQVCDGKGALADVDVSYWRSQSAAGQLCDDRAAVGKPLALTLVPVLLQGHYVGDQVDMAYSEMPWSWEYIKWLEADSSRVKARCQNVAPAWAAAVVGKEHWRATLAMPAVLVDALEGGLRPRDLHLECLLSSPDTFTPALLELSPDEPLVRLHRHQQALAEHMSAEGPQALPDLPAASDVLADKALRGYPKLVGLLLNDPLFEFRHAVEQSRLATETLQTCNALIPYQPHGRYAELLHQWAMSADAPLASLRAQVDTQALDKSMMEQERRMARDCLHRQLDRTMSLCHGGLSVVWNDWIYTRDERLLEPYSLLIELLEQLGRLPHDTDARSTAADSRRLSRSIERLVTHLAEASHPLTRTALVAGEGELPELARRLAELAAKAQPADPENMGISTLALFAGMESQGDANYQYSTQNLALAVDEWLAHLSKVMLMTLRKLRVDPSTVQVELPRLFTPTMGLLKSLHSRAKSLQFLPQGQALAQDMVVLGVHGAGLSFGLTPSERATLTRENYLYSNLQGRSGDVLGTSSGKLAKANHFASKDLGRLMVVAAPANDPLVQELNSWRVGVSNVGRATQLAKSPALPLLATVMAAYNLHVNTVGAAGLLEEGQQGRWLAGWISALADLSLASNNVALKVVERTGARSPWYLLWEQGRIDVSKVSERWAGNLQKRTGSTWLNASRIAGGAAMGITALIFVWDAKRAFDAGDKDVSVANAIAAGGGAIWALYTIGILASPWVLAAGVVLLIGGALAAALMADGAIEQAIKHGPFGIEHRLPHMNDPRIAYQQLLGAIGEPQAKISRLSVWTAAAPEEERRKLELAARESLRQLHPLDWVVELQSGLLGQYPNDSRFRLMASELQWVRGHQTGWKRLPARQLSHYKLGAVVMDASRVVYVLPHIGSQAHTGLMQMQYGLKVRAQFALGRQECRPNDPFPAFDDLVLPQPAARDWAAFDPQRFPEERDVDGSVPYWLIALSERDSL